MKLKKTNLSNSPYLGIYSYTNDDFCLVPNTIDSKEEKILEEMLDAKIIKTTINQSSLLGVYLVGLGNKLIVNEDSIRSSELEFLEKEGFNVKLIKDYNALGNLISVNKNYGFASTLLSEETVKDISKFLNIEIERRNCVGIDLPGSSIYSNDNLFLVNPNISDDDFKYLENKFKVPGVATTINYGGSFVGNDVIGNKNALLVGINTSNIELMAVDNIIVDM